MRTAFRFLGRLLCWVVIVLAALSTVALVATFISPKHPHDRIGDAILFVIVAAVAAFAVRRLRGSPPLSVRLSAPFARASAREAGEDERRLLAGETVELRPTLRKTIVLLVLSGLFAAGCIAGFLASPNVVLGCGAVLFGAGTVLAVLRLVPGGMFLRLSPEGLVVRNGFRTTRWRWDDIAEFRPYEITTQYGSSTKLVGFTLRTADLRRQGFWKRLNRGLSGVDASLPDTYGLRHTDLAELLQAAHDRYATEHGPSPADVEAWRVAASVRQDRRPVVTVALALGCVGVFVLEVVRYGLFQDGGELYAAGAASRDALAAGRWWTLAAANVLHGGPIHLAVNLVALLVVGWLLEREIGAARLALLCVVGGLAASAGAILVQPHGEVVGVSGVIFAMIGWSVVRDRLATRALGSVAWRGLVLGLVYTFLAPHVSVGGHLGGLAAGLLLGRVFERGEEETGLEPQPESRPVSA